MADRGPHVPAPKVGKAKTAHQTKTREPPQKNPPKQNPKKTAPSLEPKVVVVVPVGQSETQGPLYPPDQLPDIPPDQPNQPPNNPPNQPNPPANPPNPPANPPPNPPPNQPPNAPANPPNPMQPQNPPPQVPQLNWSYFKPEFSGKPEEDAVAHLLRTNDWMETGNFPGDTKVQRFCFTLTGEARLWYETLRPVQIDWTALQQHFRQQYSKFGSTREQYFHVWRSFHYDENVETVDVYVNRITQVAALFCYGEPHILEVLKNTVPSRLYWIFYPINELRVAVETAKKSINQRKDR